MTRTAQKVEAAAKQIEKAINNAGFTARVESLNTMDALIGSLPGHGVQNVRRPYVSVFNLAHLIPTSSIWTGERKGALSNVSSTLSSLDALRDQRSHTVPPEFARARCGSYHDFRSNRKRQKHLLALIIAQLCRYRDMSVFVFDKGMSLYPLTAACGGSHYTIAGDDESLAFCPLAIPGNPEPTKLGPWNGSILSWRSTAKRSLPPNVTRLPARSRA